MNIPALSGTRHTQFFVRPDARKFRISGVAITPYQKISPSQLQSKMDMTDVRQIRGQYMPLKTAQCRPGRTANPVDQPAQPAHIRKKSAITQRKVTGAVR
ncbi:hypothetical protein [Thalassospira marina]|uniref:Uncharacterized protein n=1 Tax=Thalassospira marina TaxID=2048283 RepID=A0A2N3KZS8_9PROT|nr:hypothetical protein [Thalassospira marina]PKR56074.1 hypothetical protein COO20_02385 [Thalassospira marina]